jgi:two-component sensor histidine kinase
MGLYKNLSGAFELSGDSRNAIKNYKLYISLRDSIYSSDNKIKIANLETKRETELKDKQIKMNKLEKRFFIFGICLMLVVIAVVVRNFMIQKKANDIKEESLHQKDMLMKEIHHRVKNNLQVISALLDLQLTNISDGFAKNAMTETNTRIRSISLIHQQLYQNESINSIEFSKFARELLQQLTAVFNKSGQKITLKNNIPETLLDIDTAVPLGLILNELMTNSYKYAFANSDGEIEISLKKTDNYQLTYKDSGPGLPANFDVSSLKGLGMKVIRSLSKQIGGTFTYVGAEKSFVITFKDITSRKLTD